MGWSQGGYMFESTVIALYDIGKLDSDILEVVAEAYAGTDIDYGDVEGESNDGKTMYEIVVETMRESPVRPKGKRKNTAAWNNYEDQVYEIFKDIIVNDFGWNDW